MTFFQSGQIHGLEREIKKLVLRVNGERRAQGIAELIKSGVLDPTGENKQ